MAVVESVEMLSVDEQVGEQDVCVNVPVAPEGSPETENPAACVVPERRVAVIVFEVDWPPVTDLLPPLVREKSKVEGGGEVPLEACL